MNFEIISEIEQIEVIAIGCLIKDLNRLNKFYGFAKWRKLKGIAQISVNDVIYSAELHWYEAHGKGKKEIKIKRILQDESL